MPAEGAAMREAATKRIVLRDIPADLYDKVYEAVSELHKRGIIKTYYLEKKVAWNKRGSKAAK